MAQIGLPSLDEFVNIDELLSEVGNSFTTLDSVRWFVRRNRDHLAQNGALIVVAGRMRFHPTRFKTAAVEIGQKDAARA